MVRVLFGVFASLALALGCADGSADLPLPTDTAPAVTLELPSATTPLPPTDATGVRTDCDPSWAIYSDSDARFSICYPSEWLAITSPPDAYLGTVLELKPSESVEGPAARFVHMTVYWAEFRSASDDECSAVSHLEDVHEEVVFFGDLEVVSCVGFETIKSPDAPPLLVTFAQIPVSVGEGVVVVFLTEPEELPDAVAADLVSVRASLRLPASD